MAVTSNEISERTASASESASTTRIRFVADAPAHADICRKFSDPRPMAAVKETSAVSPGSDSELLEVVGGNDTRALADKPSIVIETHLGRVLWKPGRATIQPGALQTLLPALIDFAFYESELRRLEQAILPHQSTADADVALAYNMAESDRSQWDRLYRTMEDLYRLRLQFARLEPHLGRADRSLPLSARRLFNRLLLKAQVENRLEALSDRLETLEDLYEGAIDRITDHRNYRKGSLLEIGIIILLAIEVILLLVHRG